MRQREGPAYFWHWILTFLGVVVIAVVFYSVRDVHRFDPIPTHTAQPGDDTRFVAMMYPKISGTPQSDSISQTLFWEHMIMLKDAGYCTVSQQQIHDLFRKGALLPEKAVVILLDGLRSNCIHATPILRELDLRATMLLNVGAMKQNNRSFINWHDLRKIAGSPHWDFGIAHNGRSDIRTLLADLKDRIADIHVSSITTPISLDPPSSFHDEKVLFFHRVEGDGYNSLHSNPSHLKVLRIEPQQSACTLNRLLSNVYSRSTVVEDEFVEDSIRLDWTSTCGEFSMRDGLLELSAEPSFSSGDMWLAGVYDWTNVDITARFRIVDGRQYWVYVRFNNEDNYVRLGCDGKRLYLQQKISETRTESLKTIDIENDLSQFHHIRLITRDRSAIAYFDDQRLSPRPFRLNDSVLSGKIGFVIWDPSCGVARCQMDRVSVRKLPCIALIDMDWPSAHRCIETHSDYLSYHCPSGLSLSVENLYPENNMENLSSVRITTAYARHELAPTIVLDENLLQSYDSDILADRLMNLVKTKGLDGLHLDGRNCEKDNSFGILTDVLKILKADSSESIHILLSLSRQHAQTREDILSIADILILELENQKDEWLNQLTRPIRSKVLLRVESTEPSAFLDGLVSRKHTEAEINRMNGTMETFEKYELKGIALCE